MSAAGRITFHGDGSVGYAVYEGERWLGTVRRDSVAEQVRPGVVRERYGWAAVPRTHVATADPVRQAGCLVFPTRREAAAWLSEGGVL